MTRFVNRHTFFMVVRELSVRVNYLEVRADEHLPDLVLS
jgi:hypothetical protein